MHHASYSASDSSSQPVVSQVQAFCLSSASRISDGLEVSKAWQVSQSVLDVEMGMQDIVASLGYVDFVTLH